MLRDTRLRLFLTSGTLLFVELLLIRWIPANVVYVGFFNNFLLLASFLGIGIGILLGRPSSLLIEQPALRYAIGSLIAFAPVFFANLVFTFSFRDSEAADLAFGANLVGAMVGGVLEWSALVTGYQALLLVVAAVYLVAWLVRPAHALVRRAQVLAAS
jgi:hypothetical protein